MKTAPTSDEDVDTNYVDTVADLKQGLDHSGMCSSNTNCKTVHSGLSSGDQKLGVNYINPKEGGALLISASSCKADSDNKHSQQVTSGRNVGGKVDYTGGPSKQIPMYVHMIQEQNRKWTESNFTSPFSQIGSMVATQPHYQIDLTKAVSVCNHEDHNWPTQPKSVLLGEAPSTSGSDKQLKPYALQGSALLGSTADTPIVLD